MPIIIALQSSFEENFYMNTLYFSPFRELNDVLITDPTYHSSSYHFY